MGATVRLEELNHKDTKAQRYNLQKLNICDFVSLCLGGFAQKSQIPPASAGWSFNFALESGTHFPAEIPPASAAWSFNFSLEFGTHFPAEIPPALAAWSFNFSLKAGTLPGEIPPASAAWSFNFSLSK